MTKGFTAGAILALFAFAGPPVAAQFTLPTTPAPEAPPDPARLFVTQCGVCHTVAAGDPHRQGPNLHGVVGRQVGQATNFRYSPAFSAAGFAWDEARLDAYLANPQAVIPGSTMAYRQANAETRGKIIAYLKEQR